jgi:beta-glucosidase/6-phospho-beta-glucosidase/beta-galactosidase
MLYVKWSTTINEPWTHALGYESSELAPGINSPGVALYQAAHNMIKAHARVYHLYAQYRAKQQGEVHEHTSENVVFACCS